LNSPNDQNHKGDNFKMPDENIPPADGASGTDEKPSKSPRSSTGWDGKLRIERTAVLANPEAISDPEYSDDEHVNPGEQIDADEGMSPQNQLPLLCTNLKRSP